jgi:hypothetical protein
MWNGRGWGLWIPPRKKCYRWSYSDLRNVPG